LSFHNPQAESRRQTVLQVALHHESQPAAGYSKKPSS